MQIAAHVLAHNVSRFLPHVLDNIAPNVDKIYVTRPPRPWNQISGLRAGASNPTNVQEILSSPHLSKIEIVQSDCENEQHHLKWRRWTQKTRNLHPITPRTWKQAIRFPGELPDFAQHFALSIAEPASRPVTTVMHEQGYDLRALAVDSLKAAKRSLGTSLRP